MIESGSYSDVYIPPDTLRNAVDTNTSYTSVYMAIGGDSSDSSAVSISVDSGDVSTGTHIV